MSTELTSAVTITPEVTGVVIDNQNDITATGTYDVTTDTSTSIVEGHKKEYSIVGDALYASINTSEAPEWLTSIISDLVSSAVASGMVNYDLLVQDVYNAIDTIDIASNTYVEQINFVSLVNALIATHLATLNVSIGDTYATKVELTALESSTTSALATEVNQLEAGYLDAIDAKATEITTAYSAADAVNASNITALTTVFNDQNSELAGQANALSGLQTHIGVDGDNTPDGTGILSRIDILEKQNDGILEYTIDTYDVMTGVQDPNNDTSDDQLVTTAEPYATWFAADSLSATEETRASHIGDVYIKYTIVNGTRVYERSYKFIKTIVDNSSPYSTDPDGYTWSLVTDTDAQNAYVAALNAQDLADAKRRVFVTQPTSGPYDIGDLWLVATGDSAIGQSISGRVIQAGDILRAQTDLATGGVYSLSHWVFASSYTNDQYAIDLENGTKQIDLSNHVNSLGWQTSAEVSTAADSAVSTFTTTVFNPAINDIGIQLDSKVESYFANTQPFDPATGTAAQNGDIWYDTDDQLLYRYTYATTSWDRIYDQEALDAASAASTAQSTADGKVTTFISDTEPTAEGNGDIWVDTANNNGFYFWDAENEEWVYVRDTSKDSDIITALQNASAAQSTADGKITSFFQDEAPDSADLGDIWFDTNDGNRIYIYEETATEGVFEWVDRQDSSIGTALQNAADAQATADGKIVTYYQDSEPTEDLTIGDLWVDTTEGTNKVHRYNGTSWDYFSDDTALDSFITVTYANDLLAIGNQIDGKADTYFQSSEPYSFDDLTEDEKALYEGDVWYDTTPTSGIEAYRFSAVDGWVLIQDTKTLEALSAASTAQATADGKIRNFTSQPIAPYSIGDTWMEGSTGDIYVCNTDNDEGEFNQSHWELASKYTDDSAVVTLNTGLTAGTVAINLSSSTVDGTNSIATYVSGQIDAQVVVYSGTAVASAPTGKDDDLFIENKEVTDSSGNKYTETTIYKWVTNAWAAQTNADTSIAALADLADGKRTIYSNQSHDVPVGEVNDIWIPTTGTNDSTYVPGEVYQYNDAGWVLATKYSEDLNAFVDTVNNTIVPTLENQIDAKIEYWFTTSSNDPKDGWTTQERVNRDGDVWYQTDTHLSFYYTESNNSWNAIQDADALDAIAAAASAQDAADGKVSQFYAWGGTSAPADYIVDSISIPANDFKYWFKTDNKLYYKPTSTWIAVPTTSNSAVYISLGDLLSVFNPVDRDTTNYSYNGTSWQQNGPTGAISTSKFFVDLENDVNGPTGSVANALSDLEISNNIYANDVGAGVESKFEYDSIIGVNGTYYTAGFGLNTTAITSGSGTEADPYDSEFWINAEKFKFTNTAQSGTTTPFSIDASGTTPQVTFNGVVSFTNVSGTPTHTSGSVDPTGTAVNGSTYRQTTTSILWVYNNGWVESGDPLAIVPDDLGATGTTIIDGGRITTRTLNGNTLKANTVAADAISADSLSAITATLGRVEITESLNLDQAGSGFLAGRSSISDYGTNGFYIGRELRENGSIGFEVSHTSTDTTTGRIKGIIHDDDQGFTIYNPTIAYGGSASGGQVHYPTSGTYNIGRLDTITVAVQGAGGGGGGGLDSGFLTGSYAGTGGTTTVVFRDGSPAGPIINTLSAMGGQGGLNAYSSSTTGGTGQGSQYGPGGIGGTENVFGSPAVGYGAGGGGAGGDDGGWFGSDGGSGGGGLAGQLVNATFSSNTTNDIYMTVTAGSPGVGGNYDYDGGNGGGGVVSVASPLGGVNPVNYRSMKLLDSTTTTTALTAVTFTGLSDYNVIRIVGYTDIGFSSETGGQWSIQGSTDGTVWVSLASFIGKTYYWNRNDESGTGVILYFRGQYDFENFNGEYPNIPQANSTTNNRYNYIRLYTNGYGTIPAGSKIAIFGGHYES